MGELLPSKLKIEDDNFLQSFEFTSQWTDIASKYIIANARLLSGDIDIANELYDEVLNCISRYGNVPSIEKIGINSKTNTVLILGIKIKDLYEYWVETHNIALIQEIHEHIEIYKRYEIINYEIETIKAIVFVLLFHDIDTALKILSIFPNQEQNATWFLNMAFLLAYKGELSSAYKEYNRALARPKEEFYDGLINKVEDFIVLMLNHNPNIIQLHYCLGIINKNFKNDSLLAKNDLLTFVSSVLPEQFINEREIANKWISQINT